MLFSLAETNERKNVCLQEVIMSTIWLQKKIIMCN